MNPRLARSRLQRLASLFPVVAVTGARQVGKSTLLAETVGSEVRTFVFDPVMDVGNARRDPELFLRLNPPPLVLDEVQFVPELLGPLKRLVDEQRARPGQYYLTGSQQFGLMRGLQETLAGRVGLLDLRPMTQVELYGDIEAAPTFTEHVLTSPSARALLDTLRGRSLQRAAPPLPERVFRGGMPALLRFRTNEVAEFFAAYLGTYVERDARLVRDFQAPHEFARFVRLIAGLTAQELNASHLGREIGITPHTARGWLDALRQGFQVDLLDAWSTNSTKRVSGRPKMHLVDTGFAAWLTAISSPVALQSHPQFAALFESYVVGEVIRQSSAHAAPAQRWHWRSAGGAEVDLVLERDGLHHLIEVKLTARPSRWDARGLAAFAESYPGVRVGQRVVVHGGPDLELLDENTLAVPVDFI
jgi:predicted AAA+ superfamily ATPase